MSYWQDKVALITGGTRGLGYALAAAFVDAGAHVVTVARSADDVARVSDALGERVLGFPADVTQQGDVESMMGAALERFGRLDVLVNNVGLSDRGRACETSAERFEELLQLNLLAAVRCTGIAIPSLTQTRGQIINIASLAGRSGFPNLGAYPASKFALVGYSHQLRLELKNEGVRVLQVCTGPIRRDDAGSRYQNLTDNLPKQAAQPGGGVKLKGIPPQALASKVLRAAERGKSELVIPFRARVLFAIAQLWPALGDWMLLRANGQ